MKSGGPTKPSHTFHKNDLVLLEATNLQTTHPKAKLAPRRYGPFKVIWTSPTNCKLELPPQMRIHPVFHNSLLKPYTETAAHGPNFERPSPEIVREEEGHYEIEKILQSRPTRNRKSTQYLVHWKGYTEADRTWIPAKELMHTKELVEQFEATQKAVQKSKEGIRALQEQGKPKEGILSWTKSTPSRNSVQTPTSPTRTSPKPSYSQMTICRLSEPAIKPGQRPAIKENLRTRDPGKLRPRDPGKSPPHDLTRDSSRDLQALKQPRDQTHDLPARDRENLTYDLPRDWSSTRSPDRVRFLRASRPLTHTWKTVGTING